MFRKAHNLHGKPVWTGCGDLLGHVMATVRHEDGSMEILVREVDGAKEWFVEFEHVKHVGERILLKGPREGFHIAPVRSTAAAAASGAAAKAL